MSTKPDTDPRRNAVIALIGFGEAGMAFAKGFTGEAVAPAIAAYDVKTDIDDASRDTLTRRYADHGVSGRLSLADALAGAGAVFSLVTADRANEAALAAAEVLPAGAWFFDCNSCAPETKRKSARAIEQAGGRYVDTAIMSPVHPRLHKSPILVSGPTAGEAEAFLAELGMRPRAVADEVGKASTIKMLRSVVMKGFESLILESVVGARRAGVDEEVLSSLQVTYPGLDWQAISARMMERALTHGRRRAAEMREVAVTVSDLDLPPHMASATVEWEQMAGDLEIDASGIEGGYGALADAIAEKLVASKTNNDD